MLLETSRLISHGFILQFVLNTQEKEVAVREKRASKEMSSAAKQVHENVKRNAELIKFENEVREEEACL